MQEIRVELKIRDDAMQHRSQQKDEGIALGIDTVRTVQSAPIDIRHASRNSGEWSSGVVY